MNKEEERNYVFAQLSSLPNAFQYVSVTNYIENLEKENQELKDNWNYIKKILKEAKQEKYISGYCGTCTDIDIDFLLEKMQELEKSDDNK